MTTSKLSDLGIFPLKFYLTAMSSTFEFKRTKIICISKVTSLCVCSTKGQPQGLAHALPASSLESQVTFALTINGEHFPCTGLSLPW